MLFLVVAVLAFVIVLVGNSGQDGRQRFMEYFDLADEVVPRLTILILKVIEAVVVITIAVAGAIHILSGPR